MGGCDLRLRRLSGQEEDCQEPQEHPNRYECSFFHDSTSLENNLIFAPATKLQNCPTEHTKEKWHKDNIHQLHTALFRLRHVANQSWKRFSSNVGERVVLNQPLQTRDQELPSE